LGKVIVKVRAIIELNPYTLVTVFTVRVGEHNFIVLTYLLTYIRGLCAA